MHLETDVTFPRFVDTPRTGTMVPKRNQMSRRKRRVFTIEQKAQAVRLAKELGSVAKTARDLDLTESSLTSWIKQAKIDEGGSKSGELTTNEREELNRLRRENRILEQERSFLKKAAAYFAEDTITERRSK